MCVAFKIKLFAQEQVIRWRALGGAATGTVGREMLRLPVLRHRHQSVKLAVGQHQRFAVMPEKEEHEVHIRTVGILRSKAGVFHVLGGVNLKAEIPEFLTTWRHVPLFLAICDHAIILSLQEKTVLRRLMDEDEIKGQMTHLMQEHRDLDDAITAITRAGTFDLLQVQRLKKRKLMLKDEIAKLKNMLVPDIIA